MRESYKAMKHSRDCAAQKKKCGMDRMIGLDKLEKGRQVHSPKAQVKV